MHSTTTEKKILGVTFFAAEKYVVTAQVNSEVYKIFQVFFSKKDGSLHVSFPYYTLQEGILSEITIPSKTSFPSDANLVPGGKVTKHRVKYSHHVSGEALFSESGKIYTKIRKKSVPLKSQHGHIFTIMAWGISKFKKASNTKDQVSSDSRTMLPFEFAEKTIAVKFVGMWYSTRNIRKNSSGKPSNTPIVRLQSSNGKIREGRLLVDPFLDDGEKYALVLYGEALDKQRDEAFTFMGGFDTPETVYDHNLETKFLAMLYPVEEADQLAKQIGSVDFS